MEQKQNGWSGIASPVEVERQIMQTIYDHGGSRIWREKEGTRELLADTYLCKEFSEAVRDFIEQWLSRHSV